MTLWPINGGYLLTITNWDDAEGTKPVSAAQGGPKYFTMVKYPTESLLWTIMAGKELKKTQNNKPQTNMSTYHIYVYFPLKKS